MSRPPMLGNWRIGLVLGTIEERQTPRFSQKTSSLPKPADEPCPRIPAAGASGRKLDDRGRLSLFAGPNFLFRECIVRRALP